MVYIVDHCLLRQNKEQQMKRENILTIMRRTKRRKRSNSYTMPHHNYRHIDEGGASTDVEDHHHHQVANNLNLNVAPPSPQEDLVEQEQDLEETVTSVENNINTLHDTQDHNESLGATIRSTDSSSPLLTMLTPIQIKQEANIEQEEAETGFTLLDDKTNINSPIMLAPKCEITQGDDDDHHHNTSQVELENSHQHQQQTGINTRTRCNNSDQINHEEDTGYIQQHRTKFTKFTDMQLEQLSNLIKIIRNGNFNEFIELLEKKGFKSNLLNVFVDGHTALHYSLIYGRSLAWCKQLVSNGANPNLTNRAGWHPIHLAAFSGSSETLSYLIDYVSE